MKPFISDMPMNQYHQVEAISSTEVRMITQGFTPAHVAYRRRNPVMPTPAMIMGTVVHAMVTGHDEEYALVEKDGRTKAGKEERAKIAEEKPDAVIINTEVFEQAAAMTRSVRHNKTALGIIDSAVLEGSFFWKEQGVLMKTRPDIVNDGLRIVADLKTARSAAPDEFVKAVKYGLYDIQAYMQVHGVTTATDREGYTFAWIVVEKEPPFECVVYEFDLGDISRQSWEANVQPLVEATKSKTWPGHPAVGHVITEQMIN